MNNDEFKTLLNDLGKEALRNSDTQGDFDSDDLINATLILSHIAHSIAWDHQGKLGFTLEQRSMMAFEFGNNIRHSLHLFCGIDLHDAVKGESWPEVVVDGKAGGQGDAGAVVLRGR